MTKIGAGPRVKELPFLSFGLPAATFSAQLGSPHVDQDSSRLHPPITPCERVQPRSAVRLRRGTSLRQRTDGVWVFLAGRVGQRGHVDAIDSRLAFHLDSLKPGE